MRGGCVWERDRYFLILAYGRDFAIGFNQFGRGRGF